MVTACPDHRNIGSTGLTITTTGCTAAFAGCSGRNNAGDGTISLSKLLAEERELKARTATALEKIEAKKIELVRNKLIRCAGFGTVLPADKPYRNGCGETSPVRLWAYQRSRHYSQLDGDYYYGTAECDHLICPKCGTENYIYNHPDKEKILEINNVLSIFVRPWAAIKIKDTK